MKTVLVARILPGLAFAALSLLILPVAQADLVTNGGFDEFTLDPQWPTYHWPQWAFLWDGQTSITGWTVTGSVPGVGAWASAEYIGTYWPDASGGVGSVHLHGVYGGPATLTQSFATVPGTQYDVTFDTAAHPWASYLESVTLRVGAAGQSGDFAFKPTSTFADMGWVARSWLFTADSDQTTLSFMSPTHWADGVGPALDNVSVVPVTPELSSASLLLAGMLPLGFAWWRRRRG